MFKTPVQSPVQLYTISSEPKRIKTRYHEIQQRNNLNQPWPPPLSLANCAVTAKGTLNNTYTKQKSCKNDRLDIWKAMIKDIEA